VSTSDSEPPVEPVFRNGTVTVVGIFLAFSLGFMSQWAGNPLPTQPIDAPIILLLSVGVVLQIYALARLLDLRSTERRVYNHAKNVFLVAVSIMSLGVVSALVIDLWRMQGN
jgi:hypothetical protein